MSANVSWWPMLLDTQGMHTGNFNVICILLHPTFSTAHRNRPLNQWVIRLWQDKIISSETIQQEIFIEYEPHHGSLNRCIPHTFTLLITSLEGFVYRIAKFLAQVGTCINQKLNEIIPITFWVMSEVIMKGMFMF